ncbi:hypothetical protein HNY73_007055 [Argiope bruennichi]|uniref:Uncharacterized protein n=1 Tax=Argiope bruennichi TaxID=94029 RepID=A0A8T0FDT5_ARGBR|nr:hypothetical protein HNY73_007055 [Argiope bruennichi]
MSLVSKYHASSEATIDVFEDVVNCDEIFKNQELTSQFIVQHIDRTSDCDALQNNYLAEGVINTIFKRQVLMLLGNRVSPVTASLVSPPKSVALPNVVLSPCANNTHNVASLPFLSVPKVCSVAKPSLQILNQSLNVERLEAIFRSMPTQQGAQTIVHKSGYSQNKLEGLQAKIEESVPPSTPPGMFASAGVSQQMLCCVSNNSEDIGRHDHPESPETPDEEVPNLSLEFQVLSPCPPIISPA